VHVLAIAATVFGIIFLAELPDKSLFASLALSIRYRRLPVWAGAASALTVHVAIAVAAGQLLTLLPHRLLEAVVAALFLAGAGYILVSSIRARDDEDADAARESAAHASFRRIFATSFGIVFLAEWGDITQITIANFTARYAEPVAVGVGAALGLASVAALAVNVGAQSLKHIPMAWVQRITGTVLLGFGIYSAVQAITG
jgi:putative Ca2+/H+ antiporter (TMEM165/GDT1 family)